MQQKIAIITGGSRGLGREMAFNLAKDGVSIVFSYHSNEEKAKGLISEIEALGQKAIADAGYHAEEDFDVVSTPNNMDSDLVKKFKRRALKRHEKFNGLLKTFKCLDQRFRHSEERFAICFEACAVICQYALECDKPLYNILVRGM